jgi:hypothetical protein
VTLQIAQCEVCYRRITKLGIHGDGVIKIFRYGVSTGRDYTPDASTVRSD